MKSPHHSIVCMLTCLTIFSFSCKSIPSSREAAAQKQLTLADPTIFKNKNVYYLYGTGSNNGFEVYRSKDLKSWEGPCGATDGFALKKGDSYGTKGFWAPQVFEYKGRIYMAYTADEHIAIASSDSPLGPFKQDSLRCISGTTKQIDPFVFFDTDGKIYLYYVRLSEGNNLYVSPMKDDLSDIQENTKTVCLQANQNWENTENAIWPVTEGPTVLKHKNIYYLFYSANDFRNVHYAVGYATSTSPDGPWTKTIDSPILTKNLTGRNGTGHGDFFVDKKNHLQYVFHLHHSNTAVSPRVTGLIRFSFVKKNHGIYRVKPNKHSFRYLKKGRI